jgi:VWFA-related protein
MGLRVRIIPANKPLGAPGDSQNSIYDDPDAPDSKGNKTDSDSSRDNASPDVDTSRNPQSSGGGLAGSNRGYDSQRRADSYPRGSSAREDVDSSTDFGGAVSRTGPPTLRRSADQGAGGADESAEPGSTRQPADEESIVLNSSLVNLHVTVFNRSGAAIGNLKKEDFKVYENNQPQEVDFFAPTSAPFNLVLLLDLSGSIQDKLDVVKSAALKFLDVIGPQDKVAVVTFTNEIRVISQLSSNRDLVRKRIKEIDRSDGGTAFYEAMWFSLMDTLKGMRGQRNAIVVMTDGVDSSLDRFSPAPSRVSFNQLARRLEETDVIVFPIYMDTEFEEVFKRGRNTSEAYAIARSQLERIAELTGGRMYQAEQVNDLSGVYKQVGAALRTVYSVGYYSTKPERDGTYRRVRISVGKPDAAVRTRRGYYAK